MDASTSPRRDVSFEAWGPGLWRFLESKMQWGDTFVSDSDSGDGEGFRVSDEDERLLALHMLATDTDKAYIRLVLLVMPCIKCRIHAHDYVQRHPPINGQDKGQWLFSFHNHVNAGNGKGLFPEDDARRAWCASSVGKMADEHWLAIVRMRAALEYASGCAAQNTQWTGIQALNDAFVSHVSASVHQAAVGEMIDRTDRAEMVRLLDVYRLRVKRMFSWRMAIVVVAQTHVVAFFPASDAVHVVEIAQEERRGLLRIEFVQRDNALQVGQSIRVNLREETIGYPHNAAELNDESTPSVYNTYVHRLHVAMPEPQPELVLPTVSLVKNDDEACMAISDRAGVRFKIVSAEERRSMDYFVLEDYFMPNVVLFDYETQLFSLVTLDDIVRGDGPPGRDAMPQIDCESQEGIQ